MVDRDRYLTLRASNDERDMLKALAEKAGVTSSDWVRLAIRSAYAESFGSDLPKKPKTKKR